MDIYLSEEEILVLKYKQPVRVDLDLHRRMDDAIHQLAGNRAYPTLVYACPGLSADRTVRKISATEAGNQHNVATAIICDSLLHKLFGNLLFAFERNVRPMRMFSSEEKALHWLSQYRSWELLT